MRKSQSSLVGVGGLIKAQKEETANRKMRVQENKS